MTAGRLEGNSYIALGYDIACSATKVAVRNLMNGNRCLVRAEQANIRCNSCGACICAT